MKHILISLFFALICIITLQAQSRTANQMNGRLSMTAASNVADSTWSITGHFTNSVSKYTASNIQVNDKFFVQIGQNTYVGRVSVINSVASNLITFRVICNYPNPPNLSSTIGAIIRATSNGYPVFVDGLPNALQAGIQNYFATLINTNAAGNPCERTITKTAHGFRKGTPIRWNGSAYIRPAIDSLIPDFIVVDSLTANTFKVSTCGLYPSTLPDGLYWYTSASPGYSLTQDTVKVPLFQVLNDTLMLNPIVGFNLMAGSGADFPTSSPPGGLTTQVQFNDSGALNGDNKLTFNKTTDVLASGKFIATDTTDAGTPNAAFLVSRELTGEINTSGHGFRDQSYFTRTGRAYNSFDAAFGMDAANLDHAVSFQSRYSTTGNVLNTYALYSGNGVYDGNVTTNETIKILELGGNGTVTNNYGVYIDSLFKGSSKKFSIYTGGNTRSYLRGGFNTKYNVGLGVADSYSPTQRLYVDGDVKFKSNLFSVDNSTRNMFNFSNGQFYSEKVDTINENYWGASFYDSGANYCFKGSGFMFRDSLPWSDEGNGYIIAQDYNRTRHSMGISYYSLSSPSTDWWSQTDTKPTLNNYASANVGVSSRKQNNQTRIGGGYTTIGRGVLNKLDTTYTMVFDATFWGDTTGNRSSSAYIRTSASVEKGTFTAVAGLIIDPVGAANSVYPTGESSKGISLYKTTTPLNPFTALYMPYSGTKEDGYKRSQYVVLGESVKAWKDSIKLFGKYSLVNATPLATSGAISTHIWTAGTPSFLRSQHGVATGTTDGSGDLTVTFAAAMPDATYTMQVTLEGTTAMEYTIHTKTTSTCKVRFYGSTTGIALTATGVTVSYESKDY